MYAPMAPGAEGGVDPRLGEVGVADHALEVVEADPLSRLRDAVILEADDEGADDGPGGEEGEEQEGRGDEAEPGEVTPAEE